MEENNVLDHAPIEQPTSTFEDTSIEQAKNTSGLKQMFQNNKGYIVFASVITTFVVLTAGVLFFVIDNDNETVIVSPEEEIEILSEVIRNNPSSLIDNTDTSAMSPDASNPQSSTDGNDSSKYRPPSNPTNPADGSPIPVPDITQDGPVGDISDQMVVPDLNVYNYRHTTITTVPGQAVSTCTAYSYLSDEVEVSEYYEYFDLGRSYYMDEITRGDELYRYYLGKYSTTESDYTVYQGGDAAAQLLFEADPEFSNEYRMDPVSYPSYLVSYPLSEIEQYFGNNATVTDMEEIDGVVYYDITTYYYSSCDYYDYSFPQRKFITIYKIDSRDFTIIEVKKFIDSVSEESLISTTTTDFNRDKVAYEEVSNYFTFSHDADVLDVNYRDYVYDAEAEFATDMQYLEDQNQGLVYSDLQKNELQYFSGKDLPERIENEEYYYLREFYPNTDKGQASYDETMYYYNQRSLYWMGFSGSHEYEYTSINIYDGSKSGDELLYERTQYNTNAIEYSDVDLVVNGELVNARRAVSVYYVTYPYPISYPVSYPGSYPVSYAISYPASYPGGYTYRFATSYVAYEYNGQVMLMSNYGYDDDYLLKQDYSISTVGEVSFTPMYNAIRDLYEWYYYPEYYCGS